MSPTLTPRERDRIVAQLRVEAVAACRQLGCTCDPEPEMKLTDRGLGRYDLPAWTSEHGDDSALAQPPPEEWTTP